MDNTIASIDELFARAQENFKKYDSQPQSKRQPNPLKRSQPTDFGKSDANPAQLCDAPDNFEPTSEPIIVVNTSHSHHLGQSSSMKPGNNARPLSCRSISNLSHLDEEGRESPRSERSKRKAYDALKAYLHGSGNTSEPMNNRLSNQETSASNEEGSWIEEGVSASEMQRREAVAASLRAAQRKICAKQNTFKPLSWSEPSFNFPSASGGGFTYSCAKPPGKGKEGGAAMKTPAANYPGLETILPRPQGSTPPHRQGSSGAFSGGHHPHHPHHQRDWTKEEIAGIVDLADRWITPDMKRRKR